MHSLNIATGCWIMSISYCLSAHEYQIKYAGGKNPKLRNLMVFPANLSLHGMTRGDSLVLCCLSVITVLQVVSHSVSRDGWEADCFPLPPDDQPVCFLLNLHFFLFKPWISFFPEKPACLITALGEKKICSFRWDISYKFEWRNWREP